MAVVVTECISMGIYGIRRLGRLTTSCTPCRFLSLSRYCLDECFDKRRASLVRYQ